MATNPFPRDFNRVPVIGGVDSSTGLAVPATIDHATGGLDVNVIGGSGGATNATIVSPLGSQASATSVSVVVASDQGTIPVSVSGVSTSANQTNGTQQTKITDGTNIVGVLKNDGTIATTQNAQITTGTGYTTGTLTLNSGAPNTVWYDMLNYAWVSVEILTNTTPATLTWQTSGDAAQTNITTAALLTGSGQGNTIGNNTNSSNGNFHGPRAGRYFRVSSNNGAGSTTIVITFYTSPVTALGSSVAQAGTWTVGSNSATGSAVPSNAFYQGYRNNSGNLQGADVLAQTSVSNDTSHQAAQLTAGAFAEQASLSTAATLNNDLVASFDASNYKWASLQVIGTWTGTISVQGSNDNSNFSNLQLYDVVNQAKAITFTANSLYIFPVQTRYFRVRVTTGGTGTVQGTMELYTTPPPAFTAIVAQSGTFTVAGQGNVLAVGSATATGSGVPANAFYQGMQDASGNLVGIRSAGSAGSTAASASNVVAVQPFLFNNNNVDRQFGNYNTTTGDTPTIVSATTTNGATQTNYNARGAIITAILGTVSGTTPAIQMQLQWSPDAGTTWLTYGTATTSLTVATGNTLAIAIYPTTITATLLGTTNSSDNTQVNAPLPRTWRMTYITTGIGISIAVASVNVNYIL